MSTISLDDVHAADTNYLVREAMTTGYQLFSLITPPAYVAFVIARRGRVAFSINRLLRATWVGGLSGTVVFGGWAYLRYAYSSAESARATRIKTAYNVLVVFAFTVISTLTIFFLKAAIIRRHDHATIGSILMAVLAPALLWRRASIVNC
ncbi:hypothetical protein K443DRAFT_101964 [Laccaria amethystina LaAM-08-1]|uniref:Uncharacterized protein n=1 Tax=Laccaria amethystina LaAM-08-1 TaxID=1095629 RepID=A0A0C9XDH7_9AGAR|nr:hypothetical protein K443DRAFT_101964 [Laccaria amethystina LaAM-08-1]